MFGLAEWEDEKHQGTFKAADLEVAGKGLDERDEMRDMKADHSFQ